MIFLQYIRLDARLSILNTVNRVHIWLLKKILKKNHVQSLFGNNVHSHKTSQATRVFYVSTKENLTKSIEKKHVENTHHCTPFRLLVFVAFLNGHVRQKYCPEQSVMCMLCQKILIKRLPFVCVFSLPKERALCWNVTPFGWVQNIMKLQIASGDFSPTLFHPSETFQAVV